MLNDVFGAWSAMNDTAFGYLNHGLKRSEYEYKKRLDEINRQMQYEFAQNSIKWRVDDAKRSGIHPLYAMGVSPSSAQPIYSTAEAPTSSPSTSGFKSFANLAQSLIDAEIEKNESEARKNDAEAKAIESQGFSFSDPSSPGSPSSQKKTSSTIDSSFVKKEKDRREILKESAQDSKISTGAYDALSKLNRGEISQDRAVDWLLTATSGFSHTSEKGDSTFQRGMKNLSESALRGLNSLINRIGESTILRFKLGNKKYYEYRKIAKEINKEYKSFDWTR